eukprot:TRINITY_DN487_c0_g2_i5.p1 TRINITY_DN487_c0_g2~~TRINITY_DN487_c0_g2_i5.p1  ORF type:complete len:747 (-),score=199.95 TRINITY_DN487_c0_g2_i5:52-2049(-)
MHKFITTCKKNVERENYFKISAKTHSKVWKNIKKYLDGPDTSWSVIYVDEKLSEELKQKMLGGKWGNIAGVHERNAFEKLFQIGTKNEVETVPFKHFLSAAHKFYFEFPIWKKIQQKIENIVIGDHKKVDNAFIEKWIRDILTSLMNKKFRDNNQTIENMEDDLNEQEKLSDNMTISKQLAEGFFNVFAGLAYTLLPSDIPIIDMKQFQKDKRGAPSMEKKCDDLLFHWAGCSILSLTGEEAKLLLGENKSDGSYLIRISHQYLFLLATFGINKIISDEKLSEQTESIIICYNNNGSFIEQPISYKQMHLTTISNQLNAFPVFKHCISCDQLCCKGKVSDSVIVPLPSSNKRNNNSKNRDNSPSGNSQFLSPGYEDTTPSFEVQDQPKRMKIGSTINIPIYSLDHTVDPTALSILHIKVSSTPDSSFSDAVIKITYHKDMTYTLECHKRTYLVKCVAPFIGKRTPVEKKILVINDPKVDTVYFLKYIPKRKLWSCGVIEDDTSYEITPCNRIFTDPPMGDTVLVCLSINNFSPVGKTTEISSNVESNCQNMNTPFNIESNNENNSNDTFFTDSNFDNKEEMKNSFLTKPTINTSCTVSPSSNPFGQLIMNSVSDKEDLIDVVPLKTNSDFLSMDTSPFNFKNNNDNQEYNNEIHSSLKSPTNENN